MSSRMVTRVIGKREITMPEDQWWQMTDDDIAAMMVEPVSKPVVEPVAPKKKAAKR